MKKKVIFIGAGGHAKVIKDIVVSCGYIPAAYVDQKVTSFFSLKHFSEDELKKSFRSYSVVMSIGGVKPDTLLKRLNLYYYYKNLGINFPAFTDKSAVISPSCKIAKGVTIGHRAIVNANAIIKDCSIINTGAIIEHDAIIEEGAHICPGAIVLGGAKIGTNSLIGSGAIILPESNVPSNYLVSAGSRFPK